LNASNLRILAYRIDLISVVELSCNCRDVLTVLQAYFATLLWNVTKKLKPQKCKFSFLSFLKKNL